MTTASGQNMTFSRFQNLTKLVYSKKVNDMVPEGTLMDKEFPFTSDAEKVGDEYHMPVTLTREGGVTFNSDGSVFALNRAKAKDTQKAKLRGAEMLVRSTMSYAVMNRAMTGTGNKEGDKKAFVNATKDTFLGLTKAGAYFREVNMLYGGGSSQDSNLGTILTVTDGTGTLTVTLTVASWSTAIWAGSEGLEFDIYSGSTKRNSAGTAAAGDNVFVLTTVTPSTRTLVFTSNATNTAAAAIGDTILFAGARTKEMLGVDAAFAASTLWNISTSSYYLWKPKSLTVSGQLTLEKVLAGCAKAADVGFEGTINVHVNPYTWQDLADDQAALVRHDKAGGKVTAGFSEIAFYGQTGQVVIKPNKFVKQGEAFGLPKGHCMRVGSTDLTFEQPGFGKMLRELEDSAGIEARIYADQAIFCDFPGAMIKWTSITNTAAA